MVDESTMKRLAFVRYLHGIAVSQSTQPEPLSSASILMFHDSVELFLQLACEHLGEKALHQFMEYWSVLRQKLGGKGPTQEGSMDRLNSSRKELKHHGTLPSSLSIESCRASTSAFFLENTPLIFNIEFESISMTHMVNCADARTKLMDAERLNAEGKVPEAIDNVAVAFEMIVDDYERKALDRFGVTPFPFVQGMYHHGSTGMDFLEGFGTQIDNALRALQDALKIISLGLDYKRHTKFKLLSPTVHKIEGGPYRVYRTAGAPPPSTADFRFCYDHVIESAIRLQEADWVS